MRKNKENNTRSKSGLLHWWHQKITAILLLPATLWFIFILPEFIGLEYKEKLDWINTAPNYMILSVFFIISAYHAKLGLTVVIEDYIHNRRSKKILITLITVIMLLVTFMILSYLFLKGLGK